MPKVSKYVYTCNKEQQRALKTLYDRGPIWQPVQPGVDRRLSYREFRRRAHYSQLMDCVMVPWHGMMIGIEKDGHTHS